MKSNSYEYVANIRFSVLPESMRWLLIQGRLDEVVRILKHIAETNNKEVPVDVFKKFQVALIALL